MKQIGTMAWGIKAPIIKHGDDLVKIVIEEVIKSLEENNLKVEDNDIICLTEAIVAKAEGNYATLAQIAQSLKEKFSGDKIGVVMPILSRNRFALILKAIKLAFPKVIVQLSYPFDEVGNPLVAPNSFYESKVNPYSDSFSKEEFRNLFPETKHPFTGIDYLEYYQEIIGDQGLIILSNNPQTILKYTNQVLVACCHQRHQVKRLLEDKNINVFALDDILTNSINDSGFHPEYGLLGSNQATPNKLKLFPRDGENLINSIQKQIFAMFHKKVEVLVYGDGAFKDPVGGIWELADPVVAPFYTKGLLGTPNEVKLKYIADNLVEKNTLEIDKKILNMIKNKEVNQENSLGTTPRRYIDLIGSLADLISGSGDKGTPIVYIKGYFDNYAS